MIILLFTTYIFFSSRTFFVNTRNPFFFPLFVILALILFLTDKFAADFLFLKTKKKTNE